MLLERNEFSQNIEKYSQHEGNSNLDFILQPAIVTTTQWRTFDFLAHLIPQSDVLMLSKVRNSGK